MVSPIKHRSNGLTLRLRALSGLSAIFILAAVAPAHAADLGTVDGFDIRWDNTIDYTAGFRLSPTNAALLSNPNRDDGDRDFAPGLMSDRLDLLSVFDLAKDNFGFQASAEAWYDTVYHTDTANSSPATYNAISVPNTRFPRAVENLEGQYVDLRDTFVYGNFSVDDAPITVRAGRQTLLWGESLFFDENSIAAAQAPVDYVKSISEPGAYSNDVYLPTDQLSVTVQPRADIAVIAYYQFEWRASRLPGVGSYFSTTDVLGEGAERLFLDGSHFLLHGADKTPTDGQFGIALRTTLDDIDLGLYALRYDAKYPLLVVAPSATSSEYDGRFYSAYPTDIGLYGFSFSTYFGDDSVAGEFTLRRNAPLLDYAPSTPLLSLPYQIGSQGYAKGDILHAQISGAATLPPSPEWDSADLSLEIAANDFLRMTQQYAPASMPSQERLSATVRMLLEPHYFEVLPNLDVTLPVGFGYDVLRQYGLAYMERSGAGDFEAGISASYMSVWKASLTMTSFLGGPSRQALADRNFVTISIQRTF